MFRAFQEPWNMGHMFLSPLGLDSRKQASGMGLLIEGRPTCSLVDRGGQRGCWEKRCRGAEEPWDRACPQRKAVWHSVA